MAVVGSLLLTGAVVPASATTSAPQTISSETLERALVEAYVRDARQKLPSTAPSFEGSATEAVVDQELSRSDQQRVLYKAVTCYMDLLLDAAVFYIYSDYLNSLEQAKPVPAPSAPPDGVRKAPRQLEAERTEARASNQRARAQLKASVAEYELTFGVRPRVLEPALPVTALVPQTLAEATAISQEEHPAIRAKLAAVALFLGRAATLRDGFGNDVGRLYAAASPADPDAIGFWRTSGSPYARFTLPTPATAVHELTRARAELDRERDAVRQAVSVAWAALRSSEARIEKAEAELAASARIPDTRRRFLEARLALVKAQHDRVIASYGLLAAVGRLSLKTLGLSAEGTDARAAAAWQ